MEIWKDIVGYKGIYQISDLGRVKSVRRIIIRQGRNAIISERILTTINNQGGYIHVILSKDGEVKTHLVHRLVADGFIHNPELKKQVNHKNGIKTDNKAVNLEWATSKENIRHAFDSLNHKVKSGADNHMSKSVICKYGIEVNEYGSIKIAAEKTGIPRTSIARFSRERRNGWAFKENTPYGS